MPVYFIDSSALVKRYRKEAGSRRVAELLRDAEQVVVARLTAVEVTSALVRRARATAIPDNTLKTALADLNSDLKNSFDVIELDIPVIELAIGIAKKYGLRGTDAVQLACLICAHGPTPGSQVILLSADAELNAAAASEGLPVENPNDHP